MPLSSGGSRVHSLNPHCGRPCTLASVKAWELSVHFCRYLICSEAGSHTLHRWRRNLARHCSAWSVRGDGVWNPETENFTSFGNVIAPYRDVSFVRLLQNFHSCLHFLNFIYFAEQIGTHHKDLISSVWNAFHPHFSGSLAAKLLIDTKKNGVPTFTDLSPQSLDCARRRDRRRKHWFLLSALLYLNCQRSL